MIKVKKQYRYFCGCGCGSIAYSFSQRKAHRDANGEIDTIWAVQEDDQIIAECFYEEHASRIKNLITTTEGATA